MGAWLPALAPWLVGLAGFLIAAGLPMVDPGNLRWTQAGDPATHYLGWVFFRTAPWTLPPGANPAYGLEVGNSVLYSDSIPLLALLLKPLSPILPDAFQYLGLWVLICFLLQAWFGWKLAQLVPTSQLNRTLITGLLVFSPPMLNRLAGHCSLVGHWMLLAGLWLSLARTRRCPAVRWMALVAGASLVHMYLFAMVALLWVASLATRIWLKERHAMSAAREALLMVVGCTLTLWAAGFFTVTASPPAAGFGYGAYGLNLVHPFNSMGWSYVLPRLGPGTRDYEGFNYLGLGMLIGLALAVPAAHRLWRQQRLAFPREWWPLTVALIVLLVFSVSNRVGVGTYVFTYPLPPGVVEFFGIARASARMFWPVFYAICLALLTLVALGYPRRVATVLLALMLFVQVADTSPGWMPYRAALQLHGTIWPSPLTNGFWREAGSMYRTLRVVPFANQAENWSVLADYARQHRMATNAVYLARCDARQLATVADLEEKLLTQGGFAPDTLYILRADTHVAASRRIDPAVDLLANIDHLWVLAPGFKKRHPQL